MADPLRIDTTQAGVPTDAGVPLPPLGHRILRRLGAALRYRDFRVLWLGAFTSTSGTWMQKIAQSWLVFSLTGSTFFLGLDAFLGELPLLLFTLIGGVIADRHDRRRLLMGSQYVQMACAFTLAALVYWDVVRIWHILTLSFVVGCAQAFGGPAYQSLIPTLVRKDDLPNAIALNSIQFNLARAIGPLISTPVLASIGLVACFGLNGLSFLVVIVALMSLHVKHIAPPNRQRLLEEMRGGLSYVRHQPSLVGLTTLVFLTMFLAMPLLVMLPVYAQRVFDVGVEGYSRMMTFSGLGAVLGALVVAWLGRFPHMGRTVLLVQFVFGVLLVGFSQSRLLWASHLLLFVGGAALMICTSLMTSLVQLIAPNELRGRVVSIYMMALRGGMPLGNLVAGYAASLSSAPLVLTVNGVLLMLVSLYFLASVPGVRRA